MRYNQKYKYMMTAEQTIKYNKRKRTMLILSVILDLIGMGTYFIPFLGEMFDMAWAPIAGMALYVMYGGFVGVFGGVFVFLEELLPFTDAIPGFLIMWTLKFVILEKKTKKQFMAENELISVDLGEAPSKSLPITA